MQEQNQIQTQSFAFNSHQLTAIVGQDNEPWFIAKEVAEILSYSDAEAMTRRLDSDEIQNRQIVGFGNRGVNLINESGLYSSILNSKKPEAKPFKKWVTAEVLPAIRKTGSYQQPNFLVPQTFAEALMLAAKIETERQSLALQIETDKPKVEFAMAVRNLNGSCTIEEFAKAIGTGRNRLYRELRELGYLQINNNPYQRHVNSGWFVLIESEPFTDRDGRTFPQFETRITGKGQVALEKKLRKEDAA